jgi:hypothetical protein
MASDLPGCAEKAIALESGIASQMRHCSRSVADGC